MRMARNIVSGRTMSVVLHSEAIASGVTRSIHATLSPNAFAPQAHARYSPNSGNSLRIFGSTSFRSFRERDFFK